MSCLPQYRAGIQLGIHRRLLRGAHELGAASRSGRPCSLPLRARLKHSSSLTVFDHPSSGVRIWGGQCRGSGVDFHVFPPSRAGISATGGRRSAPAISIFRVALMSRSCNIPHSSHLHCLTPSAPNPFGLLAGMHPQTEHVWEL
jgi:hypothetical protein